MPKFETPAFFPQMLQFKLQAVNKTKAVRSDQQLLEQPHKIKSEYNLWSIFKTTFICHFYHNLACESLKHCQSNFLFFVSLPAWIQTRVDLLCLSLSRAKVFAKLISNAVQPQFFGKRANADLCWRFQTRRATRRQANQKHETETKGSHNQSPECILLSYIHQSKNTISHKNSNTFKGVTHRSLRFQLNMTWGFQVDYLRKMVICKHLQSRAFPGGACWGSTDNEWLFSRCKHSWRYSESSRCFSVHVF